MLWFLDHFKAIVIRWWGILSTIFYRSYRHSPNTYLLVQRLTHVNASLLLRCKAFTQVREDRQARVQTVGEVTGRVVPARRSCERTAGVFTKRRPARDWPPPKLSSHRRRLFLPPGRTQPPPPSPRHLPPKPPPAHYCIRKINLATWDFYGNKITASFGGSMSRPHLLSRPIAIPQHHHTCHHVTRPHHDHVICPRARLRPHLGNYAT